jgi:hypothetical protein
VPGSGSSGQQQQQQQGQQHGNREGIVTELHIKAAAASINFKRPGAAAGDVGETPSSSRGSRGVSKLLKSSKKSVLHGVGGGLAGAGHGHGHGSTGGARSGMISHVSCQPPPPDQSPNIVRRISFDCEDPRRPHQEAQQVDGENQPHLQQQQQQEQHLQWCGSPRRQLLNDNKIIDHVTLLTSSEDEDA